MFGFKTKPTEILSSQGTTLVNSRSFLFTLLREKEAFVIEFSLLGIFGKNDSKSRAVVDGGLTIYKFLLNSLADQEIDLHDLDLSSIKRKISSVDQTASVDFANAVAAELFSENRHEELIVFITPFLGAKEAWSQVIMGQCCLGGFGLERDTDVALHYFSLSAQQRYPRAQLLLGHLCLQEGNHVQGREWLEEAYNSGFHVAAEYIVQSYLDNSPSPGSSDFESALTWLIKLAEEEDANAMHQLAWMLGEKKDPKSLQAALDWYEKAAGMGNGDSAYNAGQAFERGHGTEIDYEAARKYYLISAEAGLTSALHNLGALNFNGQGGPVDKGAAFKFYNKAAGQGSFLSSFSISKMFAAGEVPNLGSNVGFEFAWILIAEKQAGQLGQRDSGIESRKKQMATALAPEEAADTIFMLEEAGKSLTNCVPEILATLYESGELVEQDVVKAGQWRERIPIFDELKDSAQASLRSPNDLVELPKSTESFVRWLPNLGLDDQQIHGLFVLVGLYVGAPRNEEDLPEIMTSIEKVLPIDRKVELNYLVEDFYEGYDAELAEFCLKSGAEFSFRPITIRDDMDPTYIIRPQDSDLLTPIDGSMEKLADSSRLYLSLLTRLGEPTLRQERSLKESLLAGLFQIGLLAKADVSGAQQIAEVLSYKKPLLIGQLFNAICYDSIDYCSKCEVEQVALLNLMSSMKSEYVQQMWVFQAYVLFQDQQRSPDSVDLNPEEWHAWVFRRAEAFSLAHPDQLVPFSQSGVTLVDVPTWGVDLHSFQRCDSYIDLVWGFSATKLVNPVDTLEYKALMLHVIYASLAISREAKH